MGKASIIIVIGAFAIFFKVSQTINEKLASVTNYSVEFFSKLQVRNVANSTAEMLLAQLGDSTSFRQTSPSTLNNIWGGYSEYTVKDTVLDGDSLIKINVTAHYFKSTQNVSVYTFVPEEGSPGFFPATIKAAITTNNSVKTLGSLIVDGRNHDIDGNLIAGTGTMGIWTTDNYSRSGNSKVGGTDTTSGTDYAPAKNYNSDIVDENQTFPGGYPDTPDSVLGGTANGYPPGKLKGIAQSGANGSQYVTNPSNLNYPLSGVTYVELPAGGSWISSNVTGEGILIIHNSAMDAVIKNLNSGPFKGILIADDVDKIHTDIIGAVIVISPNPPSGNCIGNGNGSVLFSAQAISGATGGGNPTPSFEGRHGFNRRRMPVAHWAE